MGQPCVCLWGVPVRARQHAGAADARPGSRLAAIELTHRTPQEILVATTAQRTTRDRRLGTETKASTKTTELYVYVAAVLAVVITAFVVSDGEGAGPDPFGASEALRYITYLTIGYMIARGLAKSGSREYDDGQGS